MVSREVFTGDFVEVLAVVIEKKVVLVNLLLYVFNFLLLVLVLLI